MLYLKWQIWLWCYFTDGTRCQLKQSHWMVISSNFKKDGLIFLCYGPMFNLHEEDNSICFLTFGILLMGSNLFYFFFYKLRHGHPWASYKKLKWILLNDSYKSLNYNDFFITNLNNPHPHPSTPPPPPPPSPFIPHHVCVSAT